jgi:hypothetical protein
MQEAAFLSGLAATDWTWSVRFEDLDNDGRLDAYFTNGMVREFHNADLLGRIMSAESIPESWKLVRANPAMRERHLAFRNLGELRFEDVGAQWGLDQVGVSFGAAFGDLDGDGDLDLVYANYESGVAVLRNDSDTGHRLIVALRGTRSNRFGVGATVRVETDAGIQVRQLVLARGYLSTSEPVLHFGLGADAVIKRLTVQWPDGATQAFSDVAVDQRLTITEAAAPTVASARTAQIPVTRFRDVSADLNLAVPTSDEAPDEPNPQPMLPETFNHRGPALAVADLGSGGSDGRFALLVGATSSAPAHLLVPAAGAFAAKEIPAGLLGVASSGRALPFGPVATFDANGDGYDDVLITKSGTVAPAGAAEYQPILLLNDGQRGLAPASAEILPPVPISVGAVAVADFDRDGHLDLFIGGRVQPGSYPLPPESALLANRGGHFENVTAEIAPALRRVGLVSSALWSDVDGDGWPDLLLALEWDTVKCFHNNQGRGFEDWSDRLGFGAAGTGLWTSLASADFNRDGRPDYVVGNLGLNTPYRASATQPAVIYYGDLGGTGRPFALEACSEGDRLFPSVTRNALGARIPSILQRYRRNDLYARATLPELIGAERLAAARRFSATELRSGVFLSQSDGTYRFVPLPRITQIAPLQGIVAGDFDGDGNADIYAVQNSFAPAPAIGRFDGGLSQLLLGDGQGGFVPCGPAESGLIVPGDAKALVVDDLDGDGWPDFVISRNNATTLAFRNQGTPGRTPLRVDLHGPKSNHAAIGARVTLEFSDGMQSTIEVISGSGYYSQSSPQCFFAWTAANPPRRLLVRWPDGATTTHPVPTGARELTVAQP